MSTDREVPTPLTEAMISSAKYHDAGDVWDFCRALERRNAALIDVLRKVDREADRLSTPTSAMRSIQLIRLLTQDALAANGAPL